MHFEKASVLFNIAAVMSQQALQVERGTADGATQACKIFQVGVWAHIAWMLPATLQHTWVVLVPWLGATIRVVFSDRLSQHGSCSC